MPSGRTHDAITLLLAGPVAALAYAVTNDIGITVVTTVAFLFGGLMFGPDLDTRSKPYGRWGLFRIIWFPYRSVFKHRSRWSHGLVFGTLLRVIYFSGVVTVLGAGIVMVYSAVSGSQPDQMFEVARTWRGVGSLTREYSALGPLLAALIGLWIGAASHTMTDLAGTYIKTGRRSEIL